jgi:hypothetical protein
VSVRGKIVAKILPCDPPPIENEKSDIPYFARRKVSPEFAAAEAAGKFKAGKTDITKWISEDREDRDL